MAAWMTKYTPATEQEQDAQGPETKTAEGQQVQGPQTTEKRKRKPAQEEQKQKRKRQRSRSERSHKTQGTDGETQVTEEETNRYANHVPGELERILEEIMDAYEVTEELMGQ